MANIAQSVMDQTPDAFPDITGGAVPAPSQRGTRFPILFLIDTSGSTGHDPQTNGPGPGADIHRINAAVQGIFRNLRYPPSGTDLAAEQENIDISLISYNSRYRVNVPWTMATQLDPNIAPLQPDGVTCTGAALTYALGYIGHRIRYYTANNIRYGRPTLMHFTDGQPTDMAPGDATWKAVQAALYRVSPLNDPENRFAVIRHLVAANGNNPLTAQLKLGNGSVGTGLSLLAELSGERSALVLEDHPDLLNELVEFVTTFVSGVTNIFGQHDPDPDEVTDDALQNLDHIKRSA
ncbi:MAG: VWA domain-containing protein [Alphaproteobacteria bacterium]|nr:VWA domain-containing protein [Alphaproteobacteria bacterium]